MLKIITISLAVILAALSVADAEAGCTQAMCQARFAAANGLSLTRGRVAQVLCCCKTHSGGECCTRVAQCGGRLPGCFCATAPAPSNERLSSLGRDR
jgi:hypothetical protein